MKVLHSICQQIWKTQQRPQDWKRPVFIPVPKEGNAKGCSNYFWTFISHASKVMLKILPARFQQYMNWELPDVQAAFRKGGETATEQLHFHFSLSCIGEGNGNPLQCSCLENPRDGGGWWAAVSGVAQSWTQLKRLSSSSSWIIEKAREFQKNIYFCIIDYAKAFDCVDHNKLWKILREMGIPDHVTCLLRNLYAGQEATVRTGHGTTDWFQIRKAVHQGCILSPCFLNLYAQYIIRNAGLDEAQAESRSPGEISITSDMQMTPLLWQKVKRN